MPIKKSTESSENTIKSKSNKSGNQFLEIEQTEIFKLKSDINLMVVPKQGPIVTFGIIFQTGTLLEGAYFPLGTSQTAQSLLLSGTSKHSSSYKLFCEIEAAGGSVESFVKEEISGILVKVPRYNTHKAINLISDIVQNSLIENKNVESIKRKMLEKYQETSQSFEEMANQYIFSKFFIQDGVRNIESVLQISDVSIKDYMSHQMRPDKSYLIFEGDITQETIELIDQEFSLWHPRTKKFVDTASLKIQEELEMPRIYYNFKASNFTSLNFSFNLDFEPLYSYRLIQQKIEEAETSEQSLDIDYESIKKDYIWVYSRLIYLTNLIAGGYSSKLWSKGVEDEGLFNNVESRVLRMKDLSMIQIFGILENTQFSFGVECIFSVLENLRKTTLSITEIDRIKEYTKGQILRQIQDGQEKSGVLWQIENFVLTGLVINPEEILNEVDKISAIEIRNICLEIFNPKNMILNIIGPARETKLVDKLMERYLGRGE